MYQYVAYQPPRKPTKKKKHDGATEEDKLGRRIKPAVRKAIMMRCDFKSNGKCFFKNISSYLFCSS